MSSPRTRRSEAHDSANALEVDRLGVTLDDSPLLHDLSFSVPRGSTLAIIGANGAGKTVLLRALIGVLPSTGEIRWAPGTRIGYVPQKLDLERDLPLSGRDLLQAKADVSRAPSDALERALALVELSPGAARRRISQLSGGEFQRLLLAFALMGEPTVLLFDEPTAGLDEPGVRAVYALLRQLQEQRHLTVLLISHELSVVYEHADRVLCLSRAAVFYGPPSDVLTPDRLSVAYGSRVRFHEHTHGLD